MGGPIIRVGSTPEFAEGWDRIFGGDDQPKKSKAKGKGKKAAPKAKKSEPKAVAKKKAKKKKAKK